MTMMLSLHVKISADRTKSQQIPSGPVND